MANKYISLTGLSRFFEDLKNWMPWKKGTGDGAVKGGKGTSNMTASGDGSVAFGDAGSTNCAIIAPNNGSIATGYAGSNSRITASGRASHAEGVAENEGYITASGAGSHAEGSADEFNIIASGEGSHAEGYTSWIDEYAGNIVASGFGSHAEGIATLAQSDGEHAEGRWNVSHIKTDGDTEAEDRAGTTQHSVGVGSYNSRKNAFEIMQNGDTYIKGVGTYDGTNPTSGTNDVATVIASKANSSQLGNYLPLTGGTLTGQLNIYSKASDNTNYGSYLRNYTDSNSIRNVTLVMDATNPIGVGSDYIQLVAKSDGNSMLDVPAAGIFELAKSVYIKRQGNVGIGTDTPGYKLDVAGTIRAINASVMAGTTVYAGTNVRAAGGDVYVGSASGSQCHQQYDSTNKCLKFIFD